MRLGDPVVVALAGETNRVPLLMGVEYAVTSSVPLDVWAEDEYVTVVTNNARNYTVSWPLSFGVSVSQDGGYSIDVQPFDPGGGFSWARRRVEDNAPYQTARVLARRDGDTVGCAYTSASNWVGFTCGSLGDCGCHGCSVDGTYSIEDALFALPSIWCGCVAAENEPRETNLSVSVSFDKPVVFYEDAYTNAPGDVVAKRSTRTTLSISACGGASGGVLSVSAQNLGKLVRVGGNAVSIPYEAVVPSNATVSLSVEYEAETHSDSEGDISVSATVFQSAGGSVSDSDTATAVRVLLETQVSSVFGNSRTRHRYGIGEVVLCQHEPSDIDVTWSTSKGCVERQNGALWHFHAPLFDEDTGLAVQVGNGESYSPAISIVEPVGFYCPRATTIDSQLGENIAGGAGMTLELYITPSNVCFGNIAMEEVPTDYGQVGGYFSNEEFSAVWAHTRDRRAGQWHNVGNDNLFILEDEAAMMDELPPMASDGTLTNDVSFGWRDGVIIWTIPLGWNERGTNGDADPIKTNPVPEHQTFIITPNGTLSAIKAGWHVSHGTNTQTRIWEEARWRR